MKLDNEFGGFDLHYATILFSVFSIQKTPILYQPNKFDFIACPGHNCTFPECKSIKSNRINQNRDIKSVRLEKAIESHLSQVPK